MHTPSDRHIRVLRRSQAALPRAGVTAVLLLLLATAAAAQPRLIVEQSTCVFAPTACGDSSCTTLSLRNTGDSAVTIRSVSAGIGFSVRLSLPIVLNAGGSLQVPCCFRPATMGPSDSTQITIRGDAGASARCFASGTVAYPDVVVTSGVLRVGSVMIGRQVCGEITLENIGNAPAHIDTASGFPGNITVSPLPSELAPGARAQVTICVTGDRLGMHIADITLGTHPRCEQVRLIRASVQYSVYDEVQIRLKAPAAVRPGDAACITLTAVKPLPLEYAMREMRLKLKYDKSLLLADLKDSASTAACIITEGTASAAVRTVTAAELFDQSPDAVLDIRCAGAAIWSTAAMQPLLQVRLTGLVGRALSSTVRLVSAEFGDAAQQGELRVLPSDSVTITIDSMCRLSDRLLVLRSKPVQFRGNAPNPVSGETVLRYAVMEPGIVRIELTDMLGRACAAWDAGNQEIGEHTFPIDMRGLRADAYLCRLIHAHGIDTHVLLKSGRESR